MITRTTTEVKYLRIKSPAWVAIGHGFSETVPGHLWYEGPFVSEADAEEKFALAMKAYNDPAKRPHEWLKAPETFIFWKTLDITNNL